MALGALIALPGATMATPEPADAARWLQRMSESTKTLNYSGYLVYDRGGELETLELAHTVVAGVEREQMRYLNGPERSMVRDGAHVTCMEGGQAKARFQRGVPGLRGVGAEPAALESLSRFYRFSLAGQDRVAGRSAVVLNVQPLDPHRYGYRLALDQDTGLMLSAHTLSGERPLERFKFVQLETAQPRVANAVPMPDQRSHPAGDVVPFAVKVAWLPGGFQLMPAEPGAGRVGLNADRYSDGLALFSVFVERLNKAMPPAFVRQGATTLLSRSLTRDGQHYSVTLVGEIPAEAAEAILASVELVEPKP